MDGFFGFEWWDGVATGVCGATAGGAAGLGVEGVVECDVVAFTGAGGAAGVVVGAGGEGASSVEGGGMFTAGSTGRAAAVTWAGGVVGADERELTA